MSVSPRSIGRSVGRRLTYANVASTAALFVALTTGTAYAANTIFSGDIVNGEVKKADLAANAVASGKIGDGQVKAPDLADDAVGAAELGAGSVDAAALQSAVVGTGSVLNESLTQADLGPDSVGPSEIADDSIDSGEILDESLTAADLGAGSVGTSEVANNSLTTADILGADVNGGGFNVPTGYVPVGRCRQVDASVGGAVAGQAVVFSTKAALQDGILIYGQRVPSDGHVTISVCNFSGITQAAISDMPVRIITWG